MNIYNLKNIYKKKLIIENYYLWLKKFVKIQSLYERNINSYKKLVYLANVIIVSTRINKNNC